MDKFVPNFGQDCQAKTRCLLELKEPNTTWEAELPKVLLALSEEQCQTSTTKQNAIEFAEDKTLDYGQNCRETNSDRKSFTPSSLIANFCTILDIYVDAGKDLILSLTDIGLRLTATGFVTPISKMS